jgi:hypothetical protein
VAHLRVSQRSGCSWPNRSRSSHLPVGHRAIEGFTAPHDLISFDGGNRNGFWTPSANSCVTKR